MRCFFIHILLRKLNINVKEIHFILAAILYYFAHKRTILLLSNPKYHHDSEWIREQMRRKN